MKKLLGVCCLLILGPTITLAAEANLNITSPTYVSPDGEDKPYIQLPQKASPELKALYSDILRLNKDYLLSAESINTLSLLPENMMPAELNILRQYLDQLQQEILRINEAEEEFLIQKDMEEADS